MTSQSVALPSRHRFHEQGIFRKQVGEQHVQRGTTVLNSHEKKPRISSTVNPLLVAKLQPLRTSPVMEKNQ